MSARVPRSRPAAESELGLEVRRLRAVADALGAVPKGSGSWFSCACPACECPDSVALTRWGYECRWGGGACGFRGSDVREVLRLFMLAGGCTDAQTERALRSIP